ncbi:MAG: PP2C family protein-serine/threonine phosphatase [Balneolales bacterium]|nr:PP2C family protein-serine/threonine phosphatase [Balneolales bacterium]
MPNKPAVIGKPSFLFAYLGVFGIIIFLFLRTSFDFNAGSRINHTPKQAATIVTGINDQLGVSETGFNSLSIRFQDISLYDRVISESPVLNTPNQLNRNNVPINGWRVVLGTTYKEPDLISGLESTFQRIGFTIAGINNQGLVVSYRNHPERNYTRIDAETSVSVTREIIEQVFGYQLGNYRLVYPEIEQSLLYHPETGSSVPSLFYHDTLLDSTGEVRFERINPSVPGPETLLLSYISPHADSTFFQIREFQAKFAEDAGSPPGNEILSTSALLLLVGFFLLIILFTSIRQIFRGRMEWKRALFIFSSVTIAQYAWQILFLSGTYYRFFSTDVVILDLLQQFVFASIFGFYAAFAYVAWESLSRELNSGQIPVIDAVWKLSLFKKEVGGGILAGYGIAGFYFGIIAVLSISFNLTIFQSDSLFIAFREPSSLFPSLTITLNAWLTSMIFVVAHVGVIYNISAFTFRNEAVRMAITIVIAAATLYFLLPVFQTNGHGLQRALIFVSLSLFVVIAYRFFGIVSAIFSWFVLIIGFRLLTFYGSESGFMIAQGWILGGVLLIPFIFGLYAAIRGETIDSARAYSPEYEQKLQRQIRSEKELSIAKESQFALLPDKAPDVAGLDISGFFVPSYEVGGDFYDFIVSPQKNPKTLSFAVVDVSGKAMQSAFNAIFTSGLLLSRINTDNPAEILSAINPILFSKTDKQTFITCQIGSIDLESMQLTISNAGHCPPVLKRRGVSEFIQLLSPKFPLAMLPEVSFKNTKVSLQEDDVLFLYSDGLAEAYSPSGERMDFEKLITYINSLDTDTMSAFEITETVKQFVLTFSNYELVDDTTMLCIKVKK